MTSIREFRQVGTRGFFEPTGLVTFDEGVARVATAIAHARGLGLADIVINTLGLGFSSPTVMDRYTLALRVVENAGFSLRVAFVARPEFIDFQKIGSVMAQNRGVISDIFPTEEEAIDWLDARPRPLGADPRKTDGDAPRDD